MVPVRPRTRTEKLTIQKRLTLSSLSSPSSSSSTLLTLHNGLSAMCPHGAFLIISTRQPV